MAREKICGIYCIENIINGKKYVGLSTSIETRFKQHVWQLKRNRHVNRYLQFAWNKYGESKFAFYILEECKKETLAKREEYYIQLFETQNHSKGYNLTSGGDGIRDLDVDSRERIRQACIQNQVIQLNLDGSFVSEHSSCSEAALFVNGATENIRSCCDNKWGRKSSKGFLWLYKKDYNPLKNYSLVHKTNAKSVCQYDENGNLIACFSSTKEAEEKTSCRVKLISQCCHGEKRIVNGFIWRFEGDSFEKFPTKCPHYKPVYQCDLDGNVIETFRTIKEAVNKTGITSISCVLKGKTKTAGGYAWKYTS